MQRRPIRIILLAIASTVLALLGTTAIADASQAATSYSTSSAYTKGWTLRSDSMKKCVRLTVSGYVKGTWRYLYNNGDLNDLRWTDLRLVNPTVSVQGWGYTSSGCDSSKHWNMRATIRQAWYATTCDLDVFKNVSFGFPWSISASLAAPGCSSTEAGNRVTNQGPSTGELNQFNNGTPIDFEDSNATVGARRGHPEGGLDFTGAFAIQIATANSEDTDTFEVKRLTVNLNK